jgi:hypothetical protein
MAQSGQLGAECIRTAPFKRERPHRILTVILHSEVSGAETLFRQCTRECADTSVHCYYGYHKLRKCRCLLRPSCRREQSSEMVPSGREELESTRFSCLANGWL